MNRNSEYWRSAPEAVPDSARESFPEVVDSSAASTVNIEADQRPLHPDQYSSTIPTPEQNYGERYIEGGHPEQTYLAAQQPSEHHSEEGHRQADATKHVCGLRAKLFWIVITAITVLIVGAAIGVGVGVSLMARRSESVESSAASTAPVTAPASTSPISTDLSSSASVTPTTAVQSSSVSVTTTSIVGPSSTLYRDCPSSDQTIHDVTIGENTYMYRKFCNTVLVTVTTEDGPFNQATTDLNTCINKCALWNDEHESAIANGTRPCNAVCWWNSFDTQYPGQCWGFTTQNSSAGDFQFEQQVICDSAAWINES